MNTNKTRWCAAGVVLVALVGVSGCGSAQVPEPSPTATAATTSPAGESPKRLPGADESPAPAGESSPTGDAGSPAATGQSWPSVTPGAGDVSGNGVVAPSPSPCEAGDGKSFGGFMDLGRVDRSDPEAVAVEAMRALVEWETVGDTVPGASIQRAAPLLSDEVVERESGAPGRWAPVWWNQALAASAWSSATAQVAPSRVEVEAPEGMRFIGVDVAWTWHADTSEVVPEGGRRSCTVNVEETGSNEFTVAGYHCEEGR